MLGSIFGSKSKERVLMFLVSRGEGYPSEISKFYSTGLSSIQNSLENLEYAGFAVSKQVGRTRIYRLNSRHPFYLELKALVERSIEFLPELEREQLSRVRRRPRRKGKPLERS